MGQSADDPKRTLHQLLRSDIGNGDACASSRSGLFCVVSATGAFKPSIELPSVGGVTVIQRMVLPCTDRAPILRNCNCAGFPKVSQERACLPVLQDRFRDRLFLGCARAEAERHRRPTLAVPQPDRD